MNVSAPRESADVVVIGAGIIGACCALELARAGRSVVVVDRGAIASGTTRSGEGNLLVSDKLPGPELDLAVASNVMWQQLADELATDFELEHKGGLVVARSEADAVALRALGLQQQAAGIRCEPLQPDQLRSFEPELTADAVLGMSYPDDAQVQPMRACAAILRAAAERGVDIRLHAAVQDLRRDTTGAISGVVTSNGTIATACAVNATGPWANELAALAGSSIPVAPRRGFVLVTEPAAALIRHKVYSTSYVDDVGSDEAGARLSPVVEGTRAGTILIGSSRERIGFDRTVDMAIVRRMAAEAMALFPALGRLNIIRVYGGFRPASADHLPLIGWDTRVEGLLHATGHEGAGIGLAPATGQLVAALVAGVSPVVDPAPFAPARFATVAA
ncbi:MAG: FAD-dependent oxidoreductase [Mycobacteriales bacterium]